MSREVKLPENLKNKSTQISHWIDQKTGTPYPMYFESVVQELWQEVLTLRDALENVNQYVKSRKTYTGSEGEHMRILEFVSVSDALKDSIERWGEL